MSDEQEQNDNQPDPQPEDRASESTAAASGQDQPAVEAAGEGAFVTPAPESGAEGEDAPAEAAAEASAAEPSTPAGPSKRWYVVQVYSGYEQKVKLSLLERVKQNSMEHHFGDVLIPTETVQENTGGRKRVSSKTFYPGYIFVEMSMDDEAWHIVRDTPKVTGFVGGRRPQPVPAPEIQSVVQQVEEGAAKPRPRVMFSAGDHVRVNDGAFANFTGTIEEVKPEKQKVRVLVSIFGRATPVELDYGQVEKTA